MDKTIDILLSRYFSGEATDKELSQLDLWLSESETNEKYFDQLTSLYEQSSLLQPLSEFNKDESFSDFKEYIRKKETHKRKNLFRLPVFRVAAAAVILITLTFSIILLQNGNSRKAIELVTTDSPKHYELTDNIEVSIDSRSSLHYTPGKNNEVALSGKAKFSVNHESEENLLVLAGETYIKDIGTIFTVNAYPENESIIVEVEQGEVLFYTEANPGLTIKQNEIAEYNTKSKQFNLITSRKNKPEIIFNGLELRDIAKRLEAQYDVKIIINTDSLENMKINATFDPDESVEGILTIISATLSANLSQKGDTFIIH